MHTFIIKLQSSGTEIHYFIIKQSSGIKIHNCIEMLTAASKHLFVCLI